MEGRIKAPRKKIIRQLRNVAALHVASIIDLNIDAAIDSQGFFHGIFYLVCAQAQVETSDGSSSTGKVLKPRRCISPRGNDFITMGENGVHELLSQTRRASGHQPY